MKKILKYNHEIIPIIFLIFQEIFAYMLFISISNYILLIYILISLILFSIIIIDGVKAFTKEIRKNLLVQNKEILENTYTYNQLILPIGLYLALLVFNILNTGNILVTQFTIIFSVIILYFLLTHIDIFKKSHEVNEMAHHTLNATKIYLFFLLSYNIFQIAYIAKLSIIIPPILIFIIAFTLLLILIQRNKQFEKITIIYSLITSLVIGFLSFISLLFIKDGILDSFISTAFFYISVGIIHHKTEDNLSKELIMEYILFFIIMVLIVKGIFNIYV